MPSASSSKTSTMKKKRITFGVPGMMEYQSVIRFGRNTIKATFTGGSMNAIGVNPATFTTDSFLIQQAILNSSDYKRGRIIKIREDELEGEVKIERNAPKAARPRATSGEAVSEEAAQEADAPEAVPEEAGNAAEAPVEGRPASETAAGGMTFVEFDNNDDAKDYLSDNFGFVKSKLRNREMIIAAGASKGVDIRFSF